MVIPSTFSYGRNIVGRFTGKSILVMGGSYGSFAHLTEEQFLLCDESAWITAQVLAVGGGDSRLRLQ